MGERLCYNTAAGSFHTMKLCSRLYSLEVHFWYKKNKKSLFEPPFLDLEVTYVLHLQLVGKPVVDFIFVIIEHFSLSFTVQTLWAEICRSRCFSKGMGHFQRIFDREWASSTNHCLCQKTRVVVVSCGIKISAVHHLVLSQYTRLADTQTDRRTDFRQQYRALHYMPHGKNY